MPLKNLKPRPEIAENKKAYKAFSQFMGFLEVLKEQELNEEVIDKLNLEIEKVNESSLNKLRSQIKKSQLKMLQTIEKELKLVPKNYYKKTWLALGMSAFGLPLGVAFGLAMDNIGLLGVGLPIGMAIGLAVGTKMDKKAEKEGRQMNIEL